MIDDTHPIKEIALWDEVQSRLVVRRLVSPRDWYQEMRAPSFVVEIPVSFLVRYSFPLSFLVEFGDAGFETSLVLLLLGSAVN